jgi:RHS repeat-associated protein
VSNKSGISSQVLSLPSGGGALKGIGETFSPDLFTGTGNMTVPLALPPGRNGFQPKLSLGYSTGNGNGPFGLGWQLSVPGVARKTSKGVPRYRDAAGAEQQDTFVLSGAEDLVRIEGNEGVERFRPRTEGLFASIERDRTPGSDVWRVHGGDGLVSVYGTPGAAGADPATLADPAAPARVFAWRLSETVDPCGNRIAYDYLHDAGDDPSRPYAQLYLRRVRYVDHDRDGEERFLVSVSFEYEGRPDEFSDCRAGFETRTQLRCRRIEVHTHADDELLVRAYELDYLDELPDGEAPANGMSLLHRIRLIGHDGDAREALPPLEFGYTRFAQDVEGILPLTAASEPLPAGSLASDDVEVVSLFGNGLPDIVQMNGVAQFWRNQGSGVFAAPEQMPEVPAVVDLPDPGVHLADVNGDGRTDLLALGLGGYFPLGFDGRWRAEGFVAYDNLPSVSLADPDVRFMDLDGDGVVDALRTGAQEGFELLFNHPTTGWDRVETRPPLEEFPELSLGDPRVELGDLNGDGLQDLVLVQAGRIDYWPYLGHGRWGPRVTMEPGPAGLPPPGQDFDPRRVLIGDVDGDGLDDLVYVEPRRVTVWINRSGNGYSDPFHVEAAPLVGELDGVRLADALGSGTAGILWSTDAPEPGAAAYQFLDLTAGVKPYLLETVDNHMGAVTRIRCVPSTTFYLADAEDEATHWRTPLAFPVQVVEGVEAIDEVSGGRLASEYRYHHGYWDGAEREFRGFGMVEQLDTESFDRFDGPRAHFSPPTLTKTWFHLGPVGMEGAERSEADFTNEYSEIDPPLLGRAPGLDELLASLPVGERGNALRALRGQVLRTERYALDDTERAGRPVMVTEAQHAVREEDRLATPGEHRARVFFPHPRAQRTTQWERGNDPRTTFTFSDSYDELGHARRQTHVACPRGWRALSDRPTDGYLATRTERAFAAPVDPRRHVHDRLARTTTFEIVGTAGSRVLDLPSLPDGSPKLTVVADELNFYDGPAFSGLAFGQVGDFGALVRRESLAFTEEILRAAHGEGAAPPYLRPDGPPDWTEDYPPAFRESRPALAGYAFRSEDASHSGGYYVESERLRYDFQEGPSGRGLCSAIRDPLGTDGGERDTTIAYDHFELLPVEVIDPAGLVTQAEYDYRALQARLVTDPNGSQTAFSFTPLGMLAETRVMGNPERLEGDRERPSVRMDYAFDSRPVAVRTTRRVHHDTVADVPAPERDQALVTVEFSDGFGRLVQTRAQAEDVIFGDPTFGDGLLPADDGGPDPGAPVTGVRNASNVRVSGWQVYDNKGRVVERFEPFFASGFEYAAPADAELRHKTTVVYDALGRAERTRSADGSEQRVVYGIPVDLEDPERFEPTPWETFTYDANDNAGRTHPETADAFRGHWNTPSSVVTDAMGRAIVSVERAGDSEADALVTRRSYDIRGNVVSVSDALGREAINYVYDLAGTALRVAHADAGVRTAVLDAGGDPVERRDGKGALILLAHDILHRRTRVWCRDRAGDPVRLAQRVTYGDGGTSTQPADERARQRAVNRLGRPDEHYDEAGRRSFDAYDFKGNLLQHARESITDDVILGVFPAPADPDPDWHIEPWRVDWEPPEGTTLDAHAASLLEPTRHELSTDYDALNRARAMRHPEDVDGRRRELRLRHGPGGGLEQVTLDGVPIVERIAYNARGQRTLIALDNGVMTRCAYEARTSRLLGVRSERYTRPVGDPLTYRPVGAPLEDTAHAYDLIGNLLTIDARAPASGTQVEPDRLRRSFAYDPVYRLVSATGREHALSGPAAPWDDRPRPQDLTQARLYNESYQYDAIGNLTRLRHAGRSPGNASGFTRTIELEAGTSHVRAVSVGGGGPAGALQYARDANGNVTAETTSRHFEWDHSDRLTAFRTQVNASEPSIHAHYLYDAGGRRVKKLVRRQGGRFESTTYVEDIFERHRWQGDAGEPRSNDHVHVMDGERRVALLRVGPAKDDHPAPAVQYHLADHLDSATVVVDGDGAFINREEYTPYGETSFGSFARKRYRFTGKERDEENGLYYHGARYYAPWLARWVSVDPDYARFSPLTPFCYAFDNPLRFTDPTGGPPEPKDWAAQVKAYAEKVQDVWEEHRWMLQHARDYPGHEHDVAGTIERLEDLEKELKAAQTAVAEVRTEGEELAKRLAAADDPYRSASGALGEKVGDALRSAKRAQSAFGDALQKVRGLLSKYRQRGGGGGGRTMDIFVDDDVSVLARGSARYLGWGLGALGAAASIAAVLNASPDRKVAVAIEELGATAGGSAGFAVGAWGGGGAVLLLVSNPGGWVIAGALAGGIGLGYVGSEVGRWGGRKVVQGVRKVTESVEALIEFEYESYWKRMRRKHPGCPDEVCGRPTESEDAFYRRGYHLQPDVGVQR